jgi:predicted dehydrogenase
MKKITWGIIGLGKIAHSFAKALEFVPDAHLLAVASREQNKADEFANQYQVKYRYDSYEALIQNPEIEAVYIATPHVLHYENTLMCLEAKKAVLCEKPFAMNLRQVQEMVALARKEKVFLMEALWTKFLPSFQKVKELIAQGEIGEIKSIQADFGFQATNLDPEGRLLNLKLGGGSLLDVGIYPLFLAVSLLGKPQNVKAQAIFGNTGADELCSMILSYDKGQLASLTSSIIVNQSLEANIFGDKGHIRMCQPFHKLNTKIELIRNWTDIQPISFEGIGNGYNYEIAEVNRCLQAGLLESPIMTHQDSLVLMEVMDKVRYEAGIRYD